MRKLMMIELNEVNFDYVRAYSAEGKLPHLHSLMARHGIVETTSEHAYDDLEPWIQWVTAHTGQSKAEHGLFRLGDVVDRPDLQQIWEILERAGRSVGAVSPMNARNACRNAAFFVPDPWTRSPVTGGRLMRKLYAAIAQLVNDNAQTKVEPSSLAWLATGLARYASPSNYRRYARLIAAARKPWSRALILDLLLADLFSAELVRTQVDYATLFLNAAAHIQHHYLFNSTAYRGPNANPAWYIDPGADPLIEVYSLYDRIIGDLRARFPDWRMIVATGLHQDPYPETLIYWRLRDHAAFLSELGVPFARVEARMSRDFVVYCADRAQAREAKRLLEAVTADDGQKLFEVDERDDSLFVMLTYGGEIGRDLGYRLEQRRFTDLAGKTAFVAIKNGEHNGIGYMIDTDKDPGPHSQVALGSIFDMTLDHFGVPHPQAAAA